MKRIGRISVGIDVTETRVNMVVLRRTAAGYTVLDCTGVPVPERAIEGARIADPRLVAKALRPVRRWSRAASESITISPPIKGTLTRVMPLTEQDPQRIGQFVRDELKQYAILSGRQTASDFRVLTPARQDSRGTVLVAAADHENVTAMATASRLAGLQIGAIEPAAAACVRLLCTDQTPGSADKGLMVVLLKEAALTVCVVRRGLLDFIRTEILGSDAGETSVLERRITEEVAAVTRFYSLRNSDAMKEWKLALVDDDHSTVLSQVLPQLKTDIAVGSVSLVTPDSPPQEWRVDFRGHKDVSLTALGLAMREAAPGGEGSSLNLLPPEISAARSTKRNMFVMANALAILMVTIIVGTGAIALMGKRVSQNIVAMRRESLKRGDRSLPVTVDEMSYIDHRMEQVSAEVKYFRVISGSHSAVDWVQFLDDVKNAVPRGLKLVRLVSDGGTGATIQGEAMSSAPIHAFVDVLDASTQVRNASIVRQDRSRRDGKCIEYEIQCTLSPRKGP